MATSMTFAAGEARAKRSYDMFADLGLTSDDFTITTSPDGIVRVVFTSDLEPELLAAVEARLQGVAADIAPLHVLAAAALADNDEWLDENPAPSTAAAVAQVKVLTAQVNTLIQLVQHADI